MKTTIIFTVCCLSAVLGLPYALFEDEVGQAFYLVPVARQKRDRSTKLDVAKNPNGYQVTVGQQGTLYENNHHKIDATPFVSKQFGSNGPTTNGGTLGYTHLPTDSKLEITGAQTRPYGNTLDVTGTANLFKHGNSRLDATGGWRRNYGGLGGTTTPELNAGIQFTHQFGQNYWH